MDGSFGVYTPFHSREIRKRDKIEMIWNLVEKRRVLCYGRVIYNCFSMVEIMNVIAVWFYGKFDKFECLGSYAVDFGYCGRGTTDDMIMVQ